MARRLQSDKILFGTVVGLVLFGALMVFSASAVTAAANFRSSYHFLWRQLGFAVVGLGLMVAMMNVNYRRLAAPGIIFPALGLRENMTVHQVCSLVDSRRTQSSLTAAMRVFILGYFRAAVAESQEAARATTLNGAIGYVAGTPQTNGGAQPAATL